MDEFQKLNHTVWDGKHHLVWIPKYRKKTLFGDIRKHLAGDIREPAMQKESSMSSCRAGLPQELAQA